MDSRDESAAHGGGGWGGGLRDIKGQQISGRRHTQGNAGMVLLGRRLGTQRVGKAEPETTSLGIFLYLLNLVSSAYIT